MFEFIKQNNQSFVNTYHINSSNSLIKWWRIICASYFFGELKYPTRNLFEFSKNFSEEIFTEFNFAILALICKIKFYKFLHDSFW